MKLLKLFFLLFITICSGQTPPPGGCGIVLSQVSGGGTYCSGGIGLPVYLNSSSTFQTYQLRKDGFNIGAPITTTVFGQLINFGNQTQAGVYTVIAYIPDAPLCGTELMNGSATISVNDQQIVPTFNQVAPLCQGETVSALPLVSNNGITGTWSPAVVDNTQTATYFFTPSAGQCATTNSSLTIEVNATLPPTGNANQNFNYDATVSNLVATAENIKWYNTPTGGAELNSNAILINGNTYFASQTINGCESIERFAVLANVASPPTGITNILPTQCGITLSSLNSNVYASLVPFAQGYRFRVKRLDTNEIQIKTNLLRNLALSSLSFFKYNQEFQIEVAVKRNNIWETYGIPCNVTTPSITTTIVSSQCGSTLNSTTENIIANLVARASGYRFRVVNTETNSVQIIDKFLRTFAFSSVTDFSLNTIYNIDVAVKNTDGTYLPYGDVCSVIFEESIATKQVNSSNIENNLIAYPNPFDNYFNVKIDTENIKETLIIKVYDTLGRQVDFKEINPAAENNIEIGNNFPSGVYSVIITNGETNRLLKMIKR